MFCSTYKNENFVDKSDPHLYCTQLFMKTFLIDKNRTMSSVRPCCHLSCIKILLIRYRLCWHLSQIRIKLAKFFHELILKNVDKNYSYMSEIFKNLIFSLRKICSVLIRIAHCFIIFPNKRAIFFLMLFCNVLVRYRLTSTVGCKKK
jgi:hypothetical protein